MVRTVLNGLLFALIVLVLGGCKAAPPEQRLRETVARMQLAVAGGDARGFMGSVAEDFVGNDGMDRAALAQMLRAHLLLNREVGLHAGPLAIEMDGDTAIMRFTVVLTGSSGRWLPERGQLQSITSGWRQVDGQWQLYHAQWQPQGDTSLR
ncbi:MAG: YybH family protein [Stenotrophomonas sp.]